MSRRRFLWQMAVGIQSALLALVFSEKAASRSAASTPCGRLPRGLCLRDVALRGLHHRGGGFVNPFCHRGYWRPWQLLRWKLFSTNPYKHLFAGEADRPVLIDVSTLSRHNGLSITFVNHACVLIQDPACSLLIDPVFFGLMPMIHDFTPLRFAEGRLPRPDAVLITHGHYDHLDKRTLKAIGPDTHVVAPLGYDALFDDLGFQHRTRLDWFGSVALRNWRVTLVPAHHWTMRNPLVGPNTALWGGYLIRTAGRYTIYYSGDTAYFDGFGDIGREADIDLAIFCLGAYAPRWFMADSHIDPAQTVDAFRNLGAQRLLAVHWGTFRLGDEPVYLPPVTIAREMEKAGLSDRLARLAPGDTLRL